MNYNFLNQDSQFIRLINEISNSQFYSILTPELGYQHKIGHIQKVMLFSQIIGQNENLDEKQMKILLVTAAFHDSGRIKDRDNGIHGKASAEIVGKYFKKNQKNEYKIESYEIPIIQTSIAYHVIEDKIQGQVDDIVLKRLCCEYGVTHQTNFETLRKISAILKDADALDRARFSSNTNSKNSLNPELLRTKTAKNSKMIKLATMVNQLYAGCILTENYPNELTIDKDNAKTLQYLRYIYKINHSGERKVEREVSVNEVMALFKYCIKKIEEKNMNMTRENL